MSMVKFVDITRANFDSLTPKADTTLFFVKETNNTYSLYKGSILVSSNITLPAHSHTWSSITEKPTTFTPSSHGHAWGEITGKPTTFTPSSHSHGKAQITNFDNEVLALFPAWAKAEDKPGYNLGEIDDTLTYKKVTQAEKIAWNNKVDKVSDKGLSTNDYTNADKSKLDGIAPGAEVNVQVDWNETNSSSDAFIKNKPTKFTPISHNHTWSEITGKPTIPTEFTNWTQVWSGSANLNSYRTSFYQAIVPSGSYIGKRIAIEVQYGNGTAYTSKIIFGVLGSSTTTTPSTSISRGIGWSYFDGTNLRVKTLYAYTPTSNTISIFVGHLKTLFGTFTGTTIEWSTSKGETLYMRKIWVIE